MNWNALLEKTSDWDKDERYMATNDICNELAKDVKMDEVMEKRICTAILRQLGPFLTSSFSISLSRALIFLISFLCSLL